MSEKHALGSVRSVLHAALISAGLLAAGAADAGISREYLLRCDGNSCLVTYHSADSDGDGVSDVDEWAAGTNPYDPYSIPSMSLLNKLAYYGKLPSIRNGVAEVVVLPTTAPDGTAVFGGLPALPSRQSVLGQLGLNSDLLGKMGVDPSRGVRITPSFGTTNASLGGVSVLVAGIPIGLISAGDNSPNLTSLLSGSHSEGKEAQTVKSGKDADGYSVVSTVYTDGSSSSWIHKNDGKASHTAVSEWGADGNSQGRESQVGSVTQNSDGSVTHQTTTTVINGAGQKESETRVSNTTNADGTTVRTESETTTSYDAKGDFAGSVTWETTTSCEKDGSCVKTTTREACNASGDCQKETKMTTNCTKGEDCYVNPEADPPNIVDAELMEEVMVMTGTKILTVQDHELSPIDQDALDSLKYQLPGGPLVILVDPDQVQGGSFATGQMVVGPLYYNRIGGNITFVPK